MRAFLSYFVGAVIEKEKEMRCRGQKCALLKTNSTSLFFTAFKEKSFVVCPQEKVRATSQTLVFKPKAP